jgi:hypothetical protein
VVLKGGKNNEKRKGRKTQRRTEKRNRKIMGKIRSSIRMNRIPRYSDYNYCFEYSMQAGRKSESLVEKD